MPEQNANKFHTATTPMPVDRYKHGDPNRNPATVVPPAAEKDRQNLMRDCPGTTVLMRLSQFLEEELFDLAKDFDDTHDRSYAYLRWFAFHHAVGTMPTDPGMKRSWRKGKEKALSDAWEKVDREEPLVADHFLHISDSSSDQTDDTLSKVDGSFMHVLDRNAIRPGYPNWANIEFLVEFKSGGTEHDPFDDRPLHHPDATAKTRVAVRGQVMSYAERLFSYQHRTAVFLLLVNSDKFRVMRWDRSGVVVSEGVDYASTFQGMKALLQVLYAFSKLSRAGQGVDTSAVRLAEDSCGWQRMDLLAKSIPKDIDYAEGFFDGPVHEVFTKPHSMYGSLSHDRRAVLHHDPTCSCSGHKKTPPVIPVLSHIREMFRDSLVKGYPRYRITVNGEDYLVAKHIFLGFGMVGRGTRGYVALEWKTQRLVFLKDSWRPYYIGVEKEGDILAKLNANNVINVPTLLRYGDVTHTEEGWGEQQTETSRFHPETGDKKVNTTLPPFEATIKPPSIALQKLLHFVKEVTCKPLKTTTHDANISATWPDYKPAIKAAVMEMIDSEDSGMMRAGPSKTRSAPTGPAFDPSTKSPPAEPPTTGRRGTKRTYDALLAADNHMGEGLRHMVHTRLVVREICLPLTAFTSSQQFVRILFECLKAHATAYTKCKYIHRDISAGNMLIYPEIVRRASDGKYGVYWRGLLADWELAKPSGVPGARQPHRTGTWHFMSAYRLLNPTVSTTIADELESFCHVLIYGCIRRLNSSLETIHEFLNDYFAGGSFDPKYRQAACPGAKRESVVIGQILSFTTRTVVFCTPDGEIVEDHPINKLIAELLAIFHSRYVVAKWEAAQKASRPPPEKKTPEDRKIELPPTWDAGRKEETAEIFGAAPERKKGPPPQPIDVPTQEQYENMAGLDTHAMIAHILDEYIYSGNHKWPTNDVVPDRQTESSAPKAPRQASAAVSAPEQGVAPTAQVVEAEPEDVVIPDSDAEEVDKVEDSASAMVDVPEVDHYQHEEAQDPIEPVVKPAKRRRKGRIVAQVDDLNESAAADRPMRITRSRSAANIAAAAPAVCAAEAPAPALAAVAPPPEPVATVAEASSRVTRSKSGKLPPKANTAAARAAVASMSGRTTTRRIGRTRSAAKPAAGPTQAASGLATRRRTTASPATSKQNGDRRTRQS